MTIATDLGVPRSTTDHDRPLCAKRVVRQNLVIAEPVLLSAATIQTRSDPGSIRRESLDHVIILNHRHLRRVLRAYLAYYIGAARISA